MIFIKQKKLFIPQVRALNKGENADSELIWKAFEGPQAQEDVNYFCIQLFQQLIHSDKKANLLHNEQRIYATLLFMEFYKNKKKKKPETILQCGKFIQDMPSSPGKSYLEFLFLHKRESYGCFFISRLAMAPSSLDWSLSIQDQANKEFTQREEYLKSRGKHSSTFKNYEAFKYANFSKINFPQTKLLTFGYICFVDHIRKNNYEVQKQEYEHLLDCLKYLMHAVETITAAQQLLPNLIHLIMKCITFYGCPEAILKNFMVWADKIRQFPGLIGNIGCLFFNLLYDEVKIPGSAFRKKLQKDFPSLTIKENSFINKTFYLVTDQEEIYSRQQEISLSTLRKLIIVHTLKTCEFPEAFLNQFTSKLKGFSKQSTFILYDKLIRIFEVASKFDCRSKIKEVLEEYVTKLINETILKRQKLNQKGSNSMQSEEFEAFSKKSNKLGYFEYPTLEIITVPILDFISQKEGANNLNRIIQKNKADYQAKGLFKNKIPLAFHGDGFSFFKFVKAIAMNLEQTDVQEAKQFQIYYIPKHENTCRPGVGIYISRRDSWYRKFVFNIHYEKILYPHLDLNQHNKDLFPFYLYSKNIQLFLREACCSIPIRVYKCSLKISQIDQEEDLYMTSYFSMGLFSQARIIKMQKEKQRNKQQKQYNKELVEIIDEKIKKIQPMNISIDVEIVEPLTGTIRNKKQTSMFIQDLQICNLPCQYFMGKQPNPESPNLEMTILTEKNGKIFRKEIGHSDYFKESKPFDQMYQAFKDLFICKSIRSIVIESLDIANPLRVMIDGNVANKIEKITIKPCISASGVPVVLQMQCFLPL